MILQFSSVYVQEKGKHISAQETCTQMTIEILFIKDKKWKQAQMSVN